MTFQGCILNSCVNQEDLRYAQIGSFVGCENEGPCNFRDPRSPHSCVATCHRSMESLITQMSQG